VKDEVSNKFAAHSLHQNMATDTALRLSLARHVWAAHINLLPEEAPNLQLSGRGVNAVNKWYGRHGFLRLPQPVQDLVLLNLRKECPRVNQKGVLDVMTAATGPLTPNDIFEFLTSCDDADIEAVTSAVNLRAIYNNIPTSPPSEEQSPKEKVEWWQSRAAANPSPVKGTPPKKSSAIDEQLAQEAAQWEKVMSGRKAASKYEASAGGICTVCGMRPGQIKSTQRRYSMQLLETIFKRQIMMTTLGVISTWK